MPKIYRAKALDTGEWVYGENIFFAGSKPCILLDGGDLQELVAVDIATSSHSVEAYDIDNVQLFTHDIVYAKHTSGRAFFAEVLEIAGKIYLMDIYTKEKAELCIEYSIKLHNTVYGLGTKDPYPF